jgi:hypothetical protein
LYGCQHNREPDPRGPEHPRRRITMKATTKITVLAVAIAAALAAPALAFAGPGLHDMAIGEHLTLEPVLAAPVLDPAIAAHMVIDPAVFDLVASEDATLGDPPVAPKEPWVGIVVAPHTDTETSPAGRTPRPSRSSRASRTCPSPAATRPRG